jgi:hypothetical protein
LESKFIKSKPKAQEGPKGGKNQHNKRHAIEFQNAGKPEASYKTNKTKKTKDKTKFLTSNKTRETTRQKPTPCPPIGKTQQHLNNRNTQQPTI